MASTGPLSATDDAETASVRPESTTRPRTDVSPLAAYSNGEAERIDGEAASG
ncbi:hypothetical protein ACQJBY_044362 [Aegilops geniculata]